MSKMSNIYITGDIHGDFMFLNFFCSQYNTTKDDILIILGDSGLNYFNIYSNRRKFMLHQISEMPITLLCVHGNHEERVENMDDFEKIKLFNGNIWRHKEYHNILFFSQYGEYQINNKNILIIGGAYSIDKPSRLKGYGNWFESEQLTNKEKEKCFNLCKNKAYDYVFTHTCPISVEPTELFLKGYDQSKIDKSMERFLENVKNNIEFKKWYFGHYHADKEINDKFKIVFRDKLLLGD